uniref:tRNA pseudouridine(55) synthase n=1 Tax=Kalanchoe fedtschenkoi TaxID=63787 RepID=A0A7N1A6J3_KALFE
MLTGDIEPSIKDAVSQLPPQAAKDLLSAGVCVRCIFRLFGIRGQVYSFPTLAPSLIYSQLEEVIDVDESIPRCSVEANGSLGGSDTDLGFCTICLGILQFSYHDAKDKVMKNQSPSDMASTIAQSVKQEGHSISDFSLEISIPPIILENEHAVRLHLKSKYGNEGWMQESNSSQIISVKESLKFSLTGLVENVLDAKSSLSEFRIRMTYTLSKSPKTIQNIMEKNKRFKKLKHGNEKLHSDGTDAGDADMANDRAEEIVKRTLKNLGDQQPSVFPPDKVTEPCSLVVACSRASIFFGGRYLKYSRNVSQSRWIIDDERMGEASVEEIIGSNILPLCRGDAYKFHAAGREDIDVRMLGSGRPFLVEVQNARDVPSRTSMREIEVKVNNVGSGLVKVKNLDLVGSQGWNLMREGEAEKQKQYAALVWISRPLEDVDVETVVSLKEMQILQKTPIRVLHRRSPLERGRTIHWMNIERIAGSSQYFLLHLCTQAGTYIKEFVHGDLGRTHPSIGSILGCRAEILQLDVTDVKMDCFMAD